MFRLLIAEDERTAREAIQETVDWAAWGFTEILDARNGEEALDKCREHSPHLVITDIRMPGITGLELAHRLLELDQRIRVIIISAYQNPDYVHAAFRSRAFDYLLKPVRQDALIESVARAVQELVRQLDNDTPDEPKTLTLQGSINGIREQVLHMLLARNPNSCELSHTFRRLFEGPDRRKQRYSLITIRRDAGPHAEGEAGLDELENQLHEYAETSQASCFDFAQPVRIDNHEIVYVLGMALNASGAGRLPQLLEEEIRRDILAMGIRNVRLFRSAWANDLEDVGRQYATITCLTNGRMAFREHGTPLTHHEERVAGQVKEMVDERFVDTKLSVKEIAHTLSRTSAYICMVFKKAYDLTINDYINLARVREAKRLLDDSDFKFYEIAYESGFSSESYFAKVFRKYENRTPTEYRERER